MKRIILSAVVAALLALLTPIAIMIASAEKEPLNEESATVYQNEDADEVAITYGFLQTYMEQFKQELLEDIATEGGISLQSDYSEISAKEGEILLLSPNSEIIYRGGGAVAVTSSGNENEGITDMSSAKELFSGEALVYGHVYYASSTPSKKAILVTGGSAYFTVRGDYEIV